MLQGDVAERILSEAYEEGSEEFHEFVEAFSTGRSDDGLVELIRKLYTFSTSYPYPKEWLVSCKDAYQISSVKEVEQAPWMQLLKSDIEKIWKKSVCLQKQELHFVGRKMDHIFTKKP